MYNVLDIFCGAGGFSCGLEQAGFNVLAGVDNDDLALQTFEKNHTNAKAIKHDLSMINNELFEKINEIEFDNIDVLIGGPPCQGFSIAGKRLVDDPRNSLWKAYIDIVKEYSPAFLVLENVPTITSLSKGKIAQKIIESFHDLGYETDLKVLLASDFGVPQNRRRAFFVARKKGMPPFSFPTPYERKTTCAEAISDLPLLEDNLGEEDATYTNMPQSDYQRMIRGKCENLTNHTAVNHTEKTRSIIALVPDGGNHKDLPEELRQTRKVNIAWTRMNSLKPCFTIDAGHNHHFHYKANRVPTVRECARIQSFPDQFRFYGNRTSQYRQVGNAVPPLLGLAIGEEILKVLNHVRSQK